MFIIIFLYSHPVSGVVSIASRNLIITVTAGWGGVGTRWLGPQSSGFWGSQHLAHSFLSAG